MRATLRIATVLGRKAQPSSAQALALPLPGPVNGREEAGVPDRGAGCDGLSHPAALACSPMKIRRRDSRISVILLSVMNSCRG
jgi:hypothetical protein